MVIIFKELRAQTTVIEIRFHWEIIEVKHLPLVVLQQVLVIEKRN